jgi:hypothetical protein
MYEPLNTIAADYPVTCAKYDRENNLLDTEGSNFDDLQRMKIS